MHVMAVEESYWAVLTLTLLQLTPGWHLRGTNVTCYVELAQDRKITPGWHLGGTNAWC